MLCWLYFTKESSSAVLFANPSLDYIIQTTHLVQWVFPAPPLLSTQCNTPLTPLTRVSMREPMAAVPRWYTPVLHMALVTEQWEVLVLPLLPLVQYHWENTLASTRSEKAEQKDQPQYRPSRFTAWV